MKKAILFGIFALVLVASVVAPTDIINTCPSNGCTNSVWGNGNEGHSFTATQSFLTGVEYAGGYIGSGIYEGIGYGGTLVGVANANNNNLIPLVIGQTYTASGGGYLYYKGGREYLGGCVIRNDWSQRCDLESPWMFHLNEPEIIHITPSVVAQQTINDNTPFTIVVSNEANLPVDCSICFGDVSQCTTGNVSLTGLGNETATFPVQQTYDTINGAGFNNNSLRTFDVTCFDGNHTSTTGHVYVRIRMSPQASITSIVEEDVTNETDFAALIYDADDYTAVSCNVSVDGSVAETRTVPAFHSLTVFSDDAPVQTIINNFLNDGLNHTFDISCSDGISSTQDVPSVTFQVHSIETCSQSWYCTSFGACSHDLQPCLTVSDANHCEGAPFSGSLSTYDATCIDPSIPRAASNPFGTGGSVGGGGAPVAQQAPTRSAVVPQAAIGEGQSGTTSTLGDLLTRLWNTIAFWRK